MSTVFTKHELRIRSGQFEFSHQMRSGNGYSFSQLRYGADVLVSAPALESFYLLQFTSQGACEIAQGKRNLTLGAGDLLVLNPTQPYVKLWHGDCRQFIARLDRELVEQAFAARYGLTNPLVVEFAFARAPRFAADFLTQTMRADGFGFESGTALAEALVSALPPEVQFKETASTVVLVNRAEAFVDTFLHLDLLVADIAQAVGVSARTLERAFRRVRLTTVVARVRQLRLDRSRLELIKARDDGRNVTQVACGVGLVHAGRFSRLYRLRFGETPSQTLRHRPAR